MNRALLALTLLPLLAACAARPLVPWSNTLAPLSLEPGNAQGLTDGRGRFREIFCAATESHGTDLPDHQPCGEALHRVGDEPPATGRPVDLGVSSAGLHALMVPGLGFSCIEAWLDHDPSVTTHAEKTGFKATLLPVEGIASSGYNADLIAQGVEALDGEDAERPLVLIGYSKGAPDILEFLVRYPHLAERVQAVVSYAGAIGGSPLAEEANESALRLLTWVPGAECAPTDEGALHSLRPANRQAWLAANILPGHIRYYSVVAFPDPERISRGLRFSWRKLGRLKDARNDSQLVFYDQVLPNSTVLAFFNADHWAMSVPIARQHDIVEVLVASDNDFPREIAFEAILRYIEEDLSVQN